jgi:maltose O-acetyltransferase
VRMDRRRLIICHLAREYARDVWLNWILASVALPRPLRPKLLRISGVEIEKAVIMAECFFGGTRISIGTDTFINYGCFFDTSDRISIGSRCSLGPRTVIITGSHRIGVEGKRGGTLTHAPVTIGEGCWVGVGAMIMPGVTIGAGAVIAAGSVVTENCLPNHLYAGAPAKCKRPLHPEPMR